MFAATAFAMFDFSKESAHYLTLRRGDIISNIGKTRITDWLIGSLNDKVGLLPDNFVCRINTTEGSYNGLFYAYYMIYMYIFTFNCILYRIKSIIMILKS